MKHGSCIMDHKSNLLWNSCIYHKAQRISTQGAHTSSVSVLCSKYKEMYGRILKSLNIVNLHQEMFKLKLKINVKVPQLLCIVVSVALNGEFERFSGFCVDFFFYSNSRRKTHQIAQIRHSELQKRQYAATEVLLHLFWALTYTFLDISLRY